MVVFIGAASAFFVVIPLLLELWAIHLSRRPGSRGFVRWLKYILPGLFLISVLIALGSGAVEVVWRKTSNAAS